MYICRQRLSVNRNSNPYMYNMRAPGFDYMNWKPYGTIRTGNHPDEFERHANALSKYVRAVVVSGCAGSEERKWKALTESAETSALLQSQAQSRAASREQLVGPH